MEFEYTWYNYRTGEYDYRSDKPQDYSDYVHPSVLAIYQELVKIGYDPAKACVKALDLFLDNH